MPTTRRGGAVLAEQQPHSGKRKIVTRAVLALFAAGVVAAGYLGVRDITDNLGGPRCQATALGNSVTFDPAQTGHAATMTAIAVKRGLPPRAATIAIATAIQESKLRNLRYGDRDSLGLFQQRPSQGWGTEAEILDPEHAVNAFYDALVKIDGYEDMEITKVAQEVQKSAYPEAYADHEQEGRILASTLTGHSPAGLGCRLDDADRSDPGGFATALQAELGVSGSSGEGSSGEGQLEVSAGSEREAWSVGQWAVAKAEAHGVTSVRVGNREWTRTRDKDGWSWHESGGGDARSVLVAFA
jgi:hypothetical protein